MNDVVTALRPQLESGLIELGVDTARADPLLAYLSLLQRWNQTYNLTAIRDPREMLVKHLLDSLAMQAQLAGSDTLADLGSGAGLPGIPLAIVLPRLQVTLVESNGKKARFLREAVRQLQLGNATVAESRIEALDAPGQYDVITARALASLPLILELGSHLLKPAGRLLAMKGMLPIEEIAGLPAGWQVVATHVLHVPGLGAERHLVEVGRSGTGA
ncbi:MAG: 16S rRNA (guanine(527)-N(7))-methyltransferase RsmG [Pseudomonadota bacterium]|nr:16S rRNA (guanine(527)-N(7))-methyltransferase RsmG [Pseudomonadota bacterium]